MSSKNLPQKDSFGERLRYVREKILDLSRKKFVSGLDISADTLINYEKNIHRPKFYFAQKLYDKYQAQLPEDVFDWLFQEEGKRNAISEEYALIPLYDVRASEGPGTKVAEEDEKPVGDLAFRKEWLHKELHLSQQGLKLITTEGDSMIPTLNPGDILLIDDYHGQPVIDGIYAIKFDDALLVKRIQHLPGRKLQVSSDNPICSEYNVVLDMSNTDFEIVGRVIWAGKRL